MPQANGKLIAKRIHSAFIALYIDLHRSISAENHFCKFEGQISIETLVKML